MCLFPLLFAKKKAMRYNKNISTVKLLMILHVILKNENLKETENIPQKISDTKTLFNAVKEIWFKYTLW